ncbi:MAG: hypothetical protein E6X17_09830 [Sporomusaceae bacterium]|nr:hypothetical protein [Sporomusaceae bacterium]
MNGEEPDNLPLPPTVGDSNDAGIAVKAMEQANTAGAIWYDKTWRAIKEATPHLTNQQITDILTLQIQIADWNAQYQKVINDIANSSSLEEREQKISFYRTELDAFRASGIPVDNDLQYLKNVQRDTRQEANMLNQEWNTSPADVKRTDEVVKFSEKFQEKVEYNYNIIMGISPAIIDYEPGEIPDDLASQYAYEREEGMASAVGETAKEMWTYLNKPLFDSATRLTAADYEAGYWEGTMADGLTRVRVRYDEDGSVILHPEDQKFYADTMGNYSKGIIASALVQGAAPVLLSGAKGTLAKLLKVNTQESSKAVKAAEQLSRESVTVKLEKYLLNVEHVDGASKAKWFEKALGFTKENASDLARQIVFDPNKAVKTATTEFGTKYNQVIPITGPNGKTIDVVFAWIENNDGVIRLITAIPTKL